MRIQTCACVSHVCACVCAVSFGGVQVLVVTGFLVAGFTLILSPFGIKALGLTTWQRTGCLLSMPARLAIPAVKALSWNYPSLFAVSVATYTVDFAALGAVSKYTVYRYFVYDIFTWYLTLLL